MYLAKLNFEYDPLGYVLGVATEIIVLMYLCDFLYVTRCALHNVGHDLEALVGFCMTLSLRQTGGVSRREGRAPFLYSEM